jgi:hypothetical protein
MASSQAQPGTAGLYTSIVPRRRSHQKDDKRSQEILRTRFRDFNPQEIDRLTATEAFEQVAQSFGVVAIWHGESALEAFRQNQRAAFAIGVARGLLL